MNSFIVIAVSGVHSRRDILADIVFAEINHNQNQSQLVRSPVLMRREAHIGS